MRELDILTVDGAIALMGLFLRSRGQCLVPGEIATFREWDALPPWWFYRVGAWAVLPEAHIWREHWPADKRANRTPDAVLRQHCVDRLDASLESAVDSGWAKTADVVSRISLASSRRHSGRHGHVRPADSGARAARRPRAAGGGRHRVRNVALPHPAARADRDDRRSGLPGEPSRRVA